MSLKNRLDRLEAWTPERTGDTVWIPSTLEQYEAYRAGELEAPPSARVVLPPKREPIR